VCAGAGAAGGDGQRRGGEQRDRRRGAVCPAAAPEGGGPGPGGAHPPPSARRPRRSAAIATLGVFTLFDASVALYVGSVEAVAAQAWRLTAHNQGDYVGITPNFGLANTDV